MELYLFEEMARTADQHWWFAARREILAALIARLGLPAPGEARIAEIGCGTGANLKMLQGFGQVWAMEDDTFALQQARSTGVDVRKGRLEEELPFPPGGCDLVCLFDVLEHVKGDGAGLATAACLLRPGGHLIVTVPAYQWLFGPHDSAHHHYRRYNAASLKQLALDSGLSVERVGYFNTFLFPLIAASRFLDRYFGRSGSHDVAMPPRWLNRLLHRIFSAEKQLIARRFMPFGTSVIAVLALATGRTRNGLGNSRFAAVISPKPDKRSYQRKTKGLSRVFLP